MPVTPLQRRQLLLGTAAYWAWPGRAADAGALQGVWSGFLDADDPPALLTLRITSAVSAELVVVGMGALPLARFETGSGRVSFTIDRPSLRFDGVADATGELVGTLLRGQQRIPLRFVPGDLYTEPRMPTLPPGPLSAERVAALRRAAACPAMGVAWQREGAPVQVLVDGRRSVRSEAPVQPDDRWHLGSVTKNMTATLVARFVEQGRLGWDSTLGDLLGAQVPNMHAAYRALTLTHLLSHHGGLVRDAPAAAYAGLPDADQRLAYARAALQLAPIAPAGQAMVYSNADYVVTGLVLETLGGAPWEALIATHVFGPLGVRRFGFGPPAEHGQPQGHRMGARGLEPVRSDIAYALGPAGSVNMALGDLAAYLAAHRDRPGGFLSSASWERLHTPPFGDGHALGWDVSGAGVLSHGGTNGWWKSEVRVDRAHRTVTAAVTNALNRNGQKALLQLLDAAGDA